MGSSRGFIPYDARHAPKGDFVLNQDSPQARGLRSWLPLIQGDPIQMIRGAPALAWADSGGYATVIEPRMGAQVHDKPIGTPKPNLGDFGPGEPGFGACTILVWMSITGDDNTGASKIISKALSIYELFFRESTNIWELYINSSNAVSADQLADLPQLGVPRFFAIQGGGGVRRLYTNTILGAGAELPGDGTWVIDTTGDATINAGSDNLTMMQAATGSTRRYDGRFWDWRVYDYILPKAICEEAFYNPWDIIKLVGGRTYHFLAPVSGASVASSVGTSVVTAIGLSKILAVGSSVGLASITGIGVSTFVSVGSSVGVAVVSAIGLSTIRGLAASIGTSSVTGVSNVVGGNFSLTRFNTDSGSLDKVILQMETHLETINNAKVLHLIDIERLSIGGYRGTLIYDT